MRLLAALLMLLLLATFAPLRIYMPPHIPAVPQIAFDPVALQPNQLNQRSVGQLIYLGGWSIRSNDPRFGGISAMHVADGHVRAMTDTGVSIEFALPGAARTGPVAISPLAQGPGKTSTRRNRDAEAMVIANGVMWIAFEQRHEIWRYPLDNRQGQARSAPPTMAEWETNRGAEAMVRLPGGRFLVFAEGDEVYDDTTPLLLFDGDPASSATKVTALRYRAPRGHRITDAALLPDGRILLLNRRISWRGALSAKLTIGTLAKLQAGTVLESEEIAVLAPPLTIDNMEALSVTRENGRDLVWIASDDNFSPLQRTLLMKFALAD